MLFAEAPVDSDVFLSYLHHNYPAFTNEIEECADIIDGMSVADALMRMDGDDVSPPLSFQRTLLMDRSNDSSLDAPHSRRNTLTLSPSERQCSRFPLPYRNESTR